MPRPGPVVRGWCPGVFDPLLTGDGWLVRVRCPGGLVTPRDLRLVADLAADGGSGQVELTSRANLQLRGLREDALDAIGRALVDAGLVAPDAGADGWRAIVASPLAGHDPTAGADTTALVAGLADRLATEVGGAPPSKFGVVVDDGGSWPLGQVDADVHLRATSRDGWSVALRGQGWVGHAVDPAAVALAAAGLSAAQGQRFDRGDDVRGLPSVLHALGVTPPAHTDDRAELDDRPGVRAHHDADRLSLVAAPFLGRLDAATLRALADLAEQHATAIRLTTARSVALCGVRRDGVDPVRSRLAHFGFVTAATDPRAPLSACVGSRGCASARADTWAEAERLALGGTGRVHLSGCEKGCGAPPGVTHLVALDDGRFQRQAVGV